MRKISLALFFAMVTFSIAGLCSEKSISYLLLFRIDHDEWHKRPTAEDLSIISNNVKTVVQQQSPNGCWKKVRMRFEPSDGILSSHSGFGVNIIYVGGCDNSWENNLKSHLARIKTANGFKLGTHREYDLSEWPYRDRTDWIEVLNPSYH